MHRIGWAFLILLWRSCIAGPGGEANVQSFEVEVPLAPTPVRSDGRMLLAYEIHLTNFADETLTLKKIDARDAASGRVIATFADEALAGRLKLAGRPSASLAIEAGQRAIVFLELDWPAADSVPARIAHAITFERAGGAAGMLTPVSMPVGRADVPVLGAPLRGGPWVAVHDPRWPRGHRRVTYAIDGRATLPGRFAIDWVAVDAEGSVTHGDPERTIDALGYGADVLAGADATVAAVRDGMAESDSIKGNGGHALGEGAGNYVVLEVAPRRYAFYEHLHRGSVRVHVGQRVRKGEVIGALGFSGDSTGPHLHLHVADCDDPLACEGVPFEIEAMNVLGRYDDIGALGSKRWRDEQRRDLAPEWPGSNVVVRFR